MWPSALEKPPVLSHDQQERMFQLVPPSLGGNQMLPMNCTPKLFRRLNALLLSQARGPTTRAQSLKKLNSPCQIDQEFDDTKSLYWTVFQHQCDEISFPHIFVAHFLSKGPKYNETSKTPRTDLDSGLEYHISVFFGQKCAECKVHYRIN